MSKNTLLMFLAIWFVTICYHSHRKLLRWMIKNYSEFSVRENHREQHGQNQVPDLKEYQEQYKNYSLQFGVSFYIITQGTPSFKAPRTQRQAVMQHTSQTCWNINWGQFHRIRSSSRRTASHFKQHWMATHSCLAGPDIGLRGQPPNGSVLFLFYFIWMW